MEQDQDKRVILQLLLEDLDNLEDRQKGKQTAGHQTDLELGIACLREDIRITQISIDDEILALSTSTAIATDQKILASYQHEERLAHEDHQFALALSNGTSTSNDNSDPSTVNKSTSTDDDDDTVSIVMGDLMGRINLSDNASDNGEGSSRIPPSRGTSIMRECASCFTKNDEELYPPRCCGNVVPPGVALRVLNYEELRNFSERGLEWSAVDRLYCADPTCSKFIPPFAIQNEHGTCPACHQQTHLPCRSLAHPRVDCPMDESLHAVLEMAEAENWRRCFNCRTMVELHLGCNHMTCRCGREFCYVCGLVWKTCDCPRWHEDRLEEVANQAVDEEVPANADVQVRQDVFHRIVDNLLRHEDDGTLGWQKAGEEAFGLVVALGGGLAESFIHSLLGVGIILDCRFIGFPPEL
ncbi:Zinc finger C6HC-type [Penicillium coprophilum]|uniref:Zinc finger C6HC-type n=1 Tax=Penicillium coprophilum TaxID=36646 RepID=UPI002389CE6F|nr:Zinc finger C6HC-type [Penicillium coprophilum]KAJ5158154.1 Zinc finger C6HC-type [Penicillium coprophilum]